MIQQCQNKNITTDYTNKLQKNVGMTQQCQNKNLTKDDTNKVQKNVGMTQQCYNKKSRTARVQHWPFCVVIFTCWPTIYNPAFQSLFLIWNGLLELELDLESKIRPKSVKN